MLLGVFLPLFNFFIIFSVGRWISQAGVLYLTMCTGILTVVINIYNLYLVIFQNTVFYFNLGAWMHVGLLQVQWEFMLDFLTVSMLAMVSLISFVVHLYSFDYMKMDPHFSRFISYLSLFTFFMFVLVSAANLLVLFVGWEGVGICSFLLINFWYTRIQANKAALKAMFMNKIGDIGFLAGMAYLFAITRTLDFSTLMVVLPLYIEAVPVYWQAGGNILLTYLDIICFFFFIGVVGKSAQLGLHTWLPAAMEGPTPVSALIHAATMVTAGIFLLIRCSFLFEGSPAVQNLIVLLGAATAFFSAVTALFLYDIKKIIAYSTCSQLGYMAVACGLSQYTLGLFHLINHAFFKALLFLTAGAIIHSFNNEQDIRKLPNLLYRSPFLHSCMLIGSIAIMGLPYLSGFYSKDLILEVAFLSRNYIYYNVNIIYLLIFCAALCTGLYSARLYYYLFLRGGTFSVYQWRYRSPITQPFYIQSALSLLMVGSVFSGYILSDLFQSNTPWAVYTSCNSSFFMENEFLAGYIKLLPFFGNVFIICGMLAVAVWTQSLHFNQPKFGLFLQWCLFTQELQGGVVLLQKTTFLFNQWAWRYFLGAFIRSCSNNFYFNEVFNYISMNLSSYSTLQVFVNLDKGVLEWFGPRGVSVLYEKVLRAVTPVFNQGLMGCFVVVYNTLVILFFIFEYFWL